MFDSAVAPDLLERMPWSGFKRFAVKSDGGKAVKSNQLVLQKMLLDVVAKPSFVQICRGPPAKMTTKIKCRECGSLLILGQIQRHYTSPQLDQIDWSGAYVEAQVAVEHSRSRRCAADAGEVVADSIVKIAVVLSLHQVRPDSGSSGFVSESDRHEVAAASKEHQPEQGWGQQPYYSVFNTVAGFGSPSKQAHAFNSSIGLGDYDTNLMISLGSANVGRAPTNSAFAKFALLIYVSNSDSSPQQATRLRSIDLVGYDVDLIAPGS